MRLVLALLVVGCSARRADLDAGILCSPVSYHLCLIANPPLPPEFSPWHCTDGLSGGHNREWCALCSPAQPTYCFIDPGTVCVPSCATCQVPGWPQCLPEYSGSPSWWPPDLSGPIQPPQEKR